MPGVTYPLPDQGTSQMTKDRVSLDKYAAEAITANCIIWALKGLEAIVVLIAFNDHNEESTEITVQG